MSENNLITRFIFDDTDASRRIDLTEKKLLALNTDLNNLGKNLHLGKTVANDFSLAEKSVDSFKNKVDNLAAPTFGQGYYEESKKVLTGSRLAGVSADDLRRKTEDLGKPTFGGAYQEQSRTINAAFETNKKAADSFKAAAETPLKSSAGLPNAGANSLREIGKYYTETTEKFARGVPNNALFTEIEKSRFAVQKLNGQRLDGKNLDGLTQAGVRLHTELGRVQTDISRLNSALSKTTDKNIIKILNEDLTVAEYKFNRLNARTRQYENAQAGSVKKASLAGDGRFHRIQGYGAVIREFAPEGVNESVLNAGGQLAAASGIGTATLAVFGAVAVAGFGIVKITQNIRVEAERYLKTQNDITAAINNQIIGQREALLNFDKLRNQAVNDRELSKFTETASIEELNRKKDYFLQLSRLIPGTLGVLEDGKVVQKSNPSFELNSRQLLDIDARLDARNTQNLKPTAAFNQRSEDLKNTQRDVIESDRRRGEEIAKAAKKRGEDIEKANVKIKELGKVYSETFSNLSLRTNQNNPFASLFGEADKAAQSLTENLKGLSPELKGIALQLQQKLNKDSLFNTKLENDFASFDLKDRASDLRFFKTPKIDDQSKFFNDFTSEAVKQAIGANGGSSVRSNRLGSGGFSQSDIASETATNFNRVSNKDGGFGGFSQSARGFADLTEKEKNDFINKDNLSAQEKLSRSFDLAGNRTALNDEQQSTVDRKILSLSSGLRPEQLTDSQRDKVATAAEHEARRKDDYEKKAEQQRSELITLNTRIADELKLLREKSEKDGGQALKIILQDETGGDAHLDYLPKRPQ